MDRLRLGLWLLPAAALAWLAAVLVQGYEGYALPLLLMAAGWAVAAWATPAWRRVPGALGFLAAAVGVGWFYRFDLWSGLANVAGAAVAAGSLTGAAAAGTASPKALAGGLALLAVGALLWVVADAAAPEWQAGNLLALAGPGWRPAVRGRAGCRERPTRKR